LSNVIEDFTSKCDTCQQHKAVDRGHGHTAPKEAPLIPWQQLTVDLIGPWTLMVAGQEIEFRALTIIDLVINLVEIVRIKDKTFNINDAKQLVDTAIANAVYAHRCSYHGTITATPGSLAYPYHSTCSSCN
ncbi:unnamed protein product, partial [Cylindrotheca closterium]